ncbi:MAG: signal peptidase I [Patescibacteria group bacterium]|nr:signal peptidase I [Patescibacteria group bacterium]
MIEERHNSEERLGASLESTGGQKYSLRSFFWEIIKFAVIAFIVVVPIRVFIASPFIVNGSSMDPSFATGNYLVIDEISYRLEEPERGDVVVFKYPKDTSKFFIKRVIGLPGETVEIRDGKVFVINETSPGGFSLNEPYIAFPKADSSIVTLSDTEYFVMGDNREASSDSRIWGPLDKRFITGRVLLRLFPVSELGLFPEKALY